MENNTTVLIADDHTVVRSGLKALIQTEPGLKVIGEATNGSEAVENCQRLNPDILLLDLDMPVYSGHDVLKQLKNSGLKTKVLLLTMYSDEDNLVNAIEEGACGYITKDAPENELILAIRNIIKGSMYIDQTIAQKLVKRKAREKTQNDYPFPEYRNQPPQSALSSREIEVVRLVALGEADKQIADALHISIKTVESHKSRIKEKLKVKRLAELVRYAIETGIVEK